MPCAYYNEIDPKAAAWLRELIHAGVIAPGEVDERSIVDVRPSDLAGFTQCHFFAGIGVWSHALRSAGWPDTRAVWTGSCPCQSFSAAGSGGGFDDERHLWPDWFRLIREQRPGAVFGEQVASKDGLAWLDFVCADMESEGYAIAPLDLCAAGFGAPHIRQRLFFVADANGGNASAEREQRGGEQRLLAQGGGSGELAHAEFCGHRSQRDGEAGRREPVGNSIVGDAEREGLEGHGWHGDDRHEPGRIGTDQARPIAEAGPTSGFWHDAEWIACRDGKARPAKPGIFPLAYGHWNRMADVLSVFAEEAADQVRIYANASDSSPEEIMSLVQKHIAEETVQWSPGGPNRVHEKEVLQSFVQRVSSTFDRGPNGSGITKARKEANGRVLRDLYEQIKFECASLRREPEEQHARESSDVVRVVSRFLARCCEACWSHSSGTDASDVSMNISRATVLRGAGNAIVAPVAAEFIRAYIEESRCVP